MVLYWACFHFIGLFCYKALIVKAEKTCKKRCLTVVPMKCERLKNYFVLNIYFIYRYSKIKNRVTRLFFKSEAFNCEVSFYRLTLTTVIVILRRKFEVKCDC